MTDCSVCCNTIAADKISQINSDPVCHKCIRGIFRNAIRSEDNYPPRWGSQLLRPATFHNILPPAIGEAFRKKEKEYLTPPVKRIYCTNTNYRVSSSSRRQERCGRFLGQLRTRPDKANAGTHMEVKCKKCSDRSCLMCGDMYESSAHDCKDKSGSENEDVAFADLVQGKDYQICPSAQCNRKVQLRDGCNSITCQCGQYFCFICGQAATKDHWQKSKRQGGCPKWNHPSQPNAKWIVGDNEEREQAFVQGAREQLENVIANMPQGLLPGAADTAPQPVVTEALLNSYREVRRQLHRRIDELRQRNLRTWERLRDEERTRFGALMPQINLLETGVEFPYEGMLLRVTSALAEVDDAVAGEVIDETTRVLQQLDEEAIRAGLRFAGDADTWLENVDQVRITLDFGE